MTTIACVETWAISFDLPRPIRVGGFVVSRRDYTVVRVTTVDGAFGVAYALTRGAPVDLLVADLLAPVALGHEASDIPGIMDRCSRAIVALGREGLLQRALALLDIALLDLGTRAGRSTLPALGGCRENPRRRPAHRGLPQRRRGL